MDDVTNLKTMAGADNYNRWIYDIIKEHLGTRILEIGSGIGSMTQFFLNKELVIGTEINKHHQELLVKKFKTNKNVQVTNINIEQTSGDLAKYKFDTVVCINVLEHIKDDKKALVNMRKVLAKKGKLILFVPALQGIYGSVDRADNHYRRYNKKGLAKKLQAAGFIIKKLCYVNFLSIFGWYFHGKILKKKTHPKSHISMLNKFINVIAFTEKYVKPPIGLSLVAVCDKGE
jgi:2-polyprenyl-3-methyl-5-hydroxy-6-metoxy-1,4-benzoquinol methylase